MLTIASRVDVMNRLGRAMADGTRSRILLSLLERPGYPAELAQDLELTRTNVSNHLACLRDADSSPPNPKVDEPGMRSRTHTSPRLWPPWWVSSSPSTKEHLASMEAATYRNVATPHRPPANNGLERRQP